MRVPSPFTLSSTPRLGTLLLLVLALLMTCSLTRGQGPAPLSNADIIKMVHLKFGDNVIVAKIKSSACNFDTSMDALVKLKQAGVSDAVLAAMVEAGTTATPAAPSPATPPTTIGTEVSGTNSYPTETGVYFKKQDAWVEDQPEVVNWKTAGVAKTIATVGIVKGDVNGLINGAHSPNSVNTPLEFLVLAPEGVAITEYQLLHLHDEGESREFRTVTGGVLHTSGDQPGTSSPLTARNSPPGRSRSACPSWHLESTGFFPLAPWSPATPQQRRQRFTRFE